MTRLNLRLTLLLAVGLLAVVSVQAGSLEPPPGAVSPTRPPDTCYDDTGNRFVDCGDGTIKDTVTNLYWLKDANCFGITSWAGANQLAANLAHGQCGLTDGSLPGDWRLPSLACPPGSSCPFSTPPNGEFATIISASCAAPYILNLEGTGCWSGDEDGFSGVQSSYYWSATTYAATPGRAWSANLNSGIAGADNKTNDNYVWPVRGGP